MEHEVLLDPEAQENTQDLHRKRRRIRKCADLSRAFAEKTKNIKRHFKARLFTISIALKNKHQ